MQNTTTFITPSVHADSLKVSAKTSPSRSVQGTLQLGSEQFEWSAWDGQPLGQYVAMDTETTLIVEHLVPNLAMVSISDGEQHYLLKPEQLQELMLQLSTGDHHLIFHNVAFDFAVIDRYLSGIAAAGSRNWLWTMVDENRVHDTMLLTALVTLARSDNDLTPSLEIAAKCWCGVELVKDEHRLRFAETIGQRWADIDPGFLKYAAADAVATFQLFATLKKEADILCERFDLSQEFGRLTEAIQVRAAITLASIHRNGMHVDLERATKLRQRLDDELKHAVETMESIDGELWRRHKKTGERETTPTTGLPQQNITKLMEHLQRIAAEHRLNIPKTATGKPSRSVNQCWNQYRDLDPLIETYCFYSEKTKLRTFFDGLQQPHIHPKYRTLVRTGRTSCSGPNIQQLPRMSPIREAITARPGRLLFIIDYNSLELRTLATVCHHQHGFSKLRDVLVDGIDPHSYTAAMFAGVTLETFNELPNKKQLRQHAKVFNFGIPAGFGAVALVGHAKNSYGVELTQADAERFIDLLTCKVYPELGLYLAEDTAAIIAKALHADVVQVRATWNEPHHPSMIRKVLNGNPTKADGTPYKPFAIEKIWSQLRTLCRNPDLTPHIINRNTADDSPLRQLMYSSVSTITGRLRGGVSFTVAKNTPFQGLAADGCKMAMWNLMKAGFRIVAFIHDEFIIELEQDIDFDLAANHIQRICSESMQPFVPGIPVPCEYALAKRWYKGAEAVYDTVGRLQVWKPS